MQIRGRKAFAPSGPASPARRHGGAATLKAEDRQLQQAAADRQRGFERERQHGRGPGEDVAP